VAVHGAGGVGLSAIMIAVLWAPMSSPSTCPRKSWSWRGNCGAVAGIDAAKTSDVVAAIGEMTQGGAQVSMDRWVPKTCFNSIACLRRRGRHCKWD